jgi:glycosyltransferase involved in cell wall biosynthesis
MCDELIVCEDGPYSANVAKACDRYLTHSERLGHPKNLEIGIKKAVYSYICVLDADIVIKNGNLRDLCNQGKFTEALCLTPHDKKGFVIWCSVTDNITLKGFPMPEGPLLDSWADSIPKDLIVKSDKVEYEHNTGIIYSEWQKLHRAEVDAGKRHQTGFRI